MFEGLSPNSHKKIKFNCDECKCEVEREYRNYIKSKDRLHLCRSCRNKFSMKDSSVRDKIRKSTEERWKDESFRKNVSEKLSEKRTNWWKENKELVKKQEDDYRDIFNQLKDRVELLGFKCKSDLSYYFETKKIKFRCPDDKHDVEYSKKQMETIKGCFFCKQEKRFI